VPFEALGRNHRHGRTTGGQIVRSAKDRLWRGDLS